LHINLSGLYANMLTGNTAVNIS